MKNLLIIFTCLVCFSLTSMAKDSLNVAAGTDLGLAIDWESTNPDMEVYSLDKDFNYLPLQSKRGNDRLGNQTLVFEHIYSNIDLVITPLSSGQKSYEFVVYPGGDISQIALLKEAFLSNDTFLASGLKASQDNAGMGETFVDVNMKKNEERLGFKVGQYEVAQALSISFVL